MARRARILTAKETKALENAILDQIPVPKRKAITRPLLFKRLKPHLQSTRIPVSAANRQLLALSKAGKLRISTRVGMWIGGPGDDTPPKAPPGARGSLRFPNRRIRRVIGFVCTRCFRAYPSKSAAKEHVVTHTA